MTVNKGAVGMRGGKAEAGDPEAEGATPGGGSTLAEGGMSGTEAAMLMLVGYLTLLASGHRISAAESWSSESVSDAVEPEQGEVVLPGVAGLASQMMVRTARGNRQYDVPQIGKSLLLHSHTP